MYSKYTYVANITQANILSDIVAILTGTTDKNTLSAGCDKTNTDILTTYDAAGWTVHDASAGANKVCIKASCKQDAAQYKYVLVDASTAGYVMLTPYESWNATTHVGTNMCLGSNSTGTQQRYSTTTSGAMYISASARRIAMYGSSSAGQGHSWSSGPTLVLECDTGFSWCGAGQGFVPMAFWFNSGNSDITFPRHIGKGGAVATSSATGVSLNTTFGPVTQGDANIAMGAPMASGGWATPVSPIFTSYGNSSASPLVSGFTEADIFYTPGGALMLDEIAYKSKTYVAIPVNGTAASRFMLPKG